MSNINSNFQNNRIEIPSANISEERPDENVFKKAENVKNITAYGVGAKVIYFNNKRQRTEDRFAGLTKDFISDGGLKEKLSKYNSSMGVNTNGNMFKFTKKGTSLATNFPAESNYQQLTTYNVDLKVNDKERVGSADNTNLEAIANRRIFSIMDKKSKELIRYDSNNNKNNKLAGLQEKGEKTLKDQKSKSVSNILKEKPILKAKERERDKVMKNNFFEKSKNEYNSNSNITNVNSNNNDNKLAVVYSKKGIFNSSQNNSSEANNEYEHNAYENNENENYGVYENENNDNINIEQTRSQNFIIGDSNYNSHNSNNNINKANNLLKAKIKPKSLPKDQYELKQEMKVKRNNFLENQKKYAANLLEQNIKKMKEQQASKSAKNESSGENSNLNDNNIINKEKVINPGRKPTSQNSDIPNTNNNYNNNNYNNNNNHNQNRSRITNPNEKSNKLEQINKIYTTEEKLENIEKINECFEKIEIKKVERESMDKIKKKVVLVQKKLRVLQEKGIELNLDETNNENENEDAQKVKNENDEEEDKNYVFHDSDNNIEKENISSKNLNSNSENEQIVNNNKNVNNKHMNDKEDNLNFENISKLKNYNNLINNNLNQHKKPVVDTLEFVKKIQESRRKFASKSPGKSEMLNRSDSFRRSNSESNNNNKNNLGSQTKINDNNSNNNYNKFNINDYEENKNEKDEDNDNNNLQMLTNKLLLVANSDISEADKKRKDLEIKQFIERKKKEKKMVELKVQEENRKNWENKILQLLQLEKTIITKNEKINFVKKNNSNSSQNYSRQSNSANKVRNDFYIGTKKTNLNSNYNNNNLDESSILDPDDFYYTVLESKNIIVTQKSQSSNKINSVSNKNSNKSTANQLNYNNINFKTSDDFQKQNAVSRLSDFTQGNNNEIRKTDNYNTTNNEGINRKVTNITNKLSQENFLKFISENEKITLRSLDSKTSGNYVNNTNNYNYAEEENRKGQIKNFDNISNFNKNNRDNNVSNSPLNLKLTTDSKLIGSKTSNFNNAMKKSDNLFENNLENNAKKQNQEQIQLDNLSNADKELSNSPVFEKTSSKNLQKINNEEISELNKQSVLIEGGLIDRSDIEKDSFLMQFDNLLITFANKLNHVYLRKHLPELINNIIMREQIKYCFDTLNNLCNIGKRSIFNRIKEFANEAHVENIYSLFNNLTLFAKRKSMNKIFHYFAFVQNLESENNAEINNNNNNLDNNKESDLDEYENLDTKNIEEIKAQYLNYFVGIIDRSFLLTKKDAMERVFEYARNFSLYNDLHFSGGDKNNLSNNNISSVNNNMNSNKPLQTKSSVGLAAESFEESDYSDKSKMAQYYDYIKSTFDLMTRHIRKDAYYKIKAFGEAKMLPSSKILNESNRSYNSNNNYKDNNLSVNSETKREKIVLSKKSANGENSFSSVFNQNKANSFIAQSHNSSHFSLHPNSLDSPKIRKLQFKIAQKNLEREWLNNIDEKYGNSNSNVNDYHNRNGSSMNENISNKSYSNNNLNLNLQGNSSQFKDNPLVRSDDENEESKNINYSKLSIDDPFKDSKKKFYEPGDNDNDNNNNNEIVNNAEKLNDIKVYENDNRNLNNNDNSVISNSNKNNSISITINKYSTLNYNDELNLNLQSAVSEAERKKPQNENSQIQHNNRYGNDYNENSFTSTKSKNKINKTNTSNASLIFDAHVNREILNEKLINSQINKSNISQEAELNESKKASDAAGNLLLDGQTKTPKNERHSVNDEIVEEILEDNLDVSNTNRKKNLLKDASGRFIGTDIDLSADRDNTSDIDWIYTVSQSKSGSLRDVTGAGIIKQFADLAAKNEIEDNKNTADLNKEKDKSPKQNIVKVNNNNTLPNSVSIGNEIDNITKKAEKENSITNQLNISENKIELDISTNKKKEELESKIKEMQIDRSVHKNTEEDYENNYDDFENIEEDIIIDEEPDFTKILGEDSTSNMQHGSLIKSRNSLKNGSLIEEKDKEIHKIKENEEIIDIDKKIEKEDLKKGLSQNEDEKEIDLTNKKINLNVIPGKETIDSVKDIKSIESEDNDFFRIKNNNNQNILNLLDDKSSNNKSVSVNVLSHLSPDIGMVSDATSSYNLKDVQLNRETINTDYLIALDKKSENTISTLNRKPDIAASKDSLLLGNYNNNAIDNTNLNNIANNRYENFENSAKKSEAINSSKEYLSDVDMDLVSSELADKILNDLIESEIKNKEKNLIPKKIFKSEAGLINMLNSLNNTPLNRSMASLDNSMSSSINNTLFSKTVLEHKKENSLKLYIEQIGPKLIESIVEDITKNFDGVCQNLNKPYKSDSKEVIIAMSLRDRNRLKESYKYLEKPENAKNFVSKKVVLENFESINKIIREDDNIISDNYYDNIINECLADAANEILEKERVYGEMGEPLAWSSRTRVIKNKISNNEFNKNKIGQSVKKELTDMLNYRMGIIPENFDYLEPEQTNQEREKKSINHINKELNEVEELWKNYEFEETQVKLELSELVLEQLLNEIVEIFEHIYNARKKPDLYQYKSIYACEEIPRLPFQQTNTDIDLDNINQ